MPPKKVQRECKDARSEKNSNLLSVYIGEYGKKGTVSVYNENPYFHINDYKKNKSISLSYNEVCSLCDQRNIVLDEMAKYIEAEDDVEIIEAEDDKCITEKSIDQPMQVCSPAVKVAPDAIKDAIKDARAWQLYTSGLEQGGFQYPSYLHTGDRGFSQVTPQGVKLSASAAASLPSAQLIPTPESAPPGTAVGNYNISALAGNENQVNNGYPSNLQRFPYGMYTMPNPGFNPAQRGLPSYSTVEGSRGIPWGVGSIPYRL